MRWSFYHSFTPRQAGWIAGIVFTLIGMILVLIVPALFGANQFVSNVIRLLGGVFLALGVISLVWMIGDLVLMFRGSRHRERWFWWGNLLLGVLGALLFAVPAVFLFPAMLLNPGVFAAGKLAENLPIGALFSIVGLATMIALYFIVRSQLRERRWKK